MEVLREYRDPEVMIIPLEQRLNAYEEFKSFRGTMSRRDMVQEIVARYGITATTVYSWFRGSSPLGKRAGQVAKVPELLYVLGALLGDGCPYFWRGNYSVILTGEKEFATKYAAKLSACIGRKVKFYKPSSKNVWIVEVGNAELFFLLKASRKDLTVIERLAAVVGEERSWKEFIEGFFDAEGCVKVIKEKVRAAPRICLDFCNTDLELLLLVKTRLKDVLGIDSGISTQLSVPPRKTCYHLRIYSKSGIGNYLRSLHTTNLPKVRDLL